MKKSFCFFAVFTALLFVLVGVSSAQQEPQRQISTTDLERLGKILRTQEEELPAQGDRPPTKVVTETYENGTIRRYMTAESLEIRIPTANPGELSREKDMQIDRALKVLGHAGFDEQKRVVAELRKQGNFVDWYRFLNGWAARNQALANRTPERSVEVGPATVTLESEFVTPPKEWIENVLRSGRVVYTLGESSNAIIRDGFKDDESLTEMAKSNPVFIERIMQSHLPQCQKDQFLKKLRSGDFEKLHPLVPPDNDPNGFVYIDENFGAGQSVGRNEILKYDPTNPVLVATVQLDACDAAPPVKYDVVKKCANPLKRHQEARKPLVFTSKVLEANFITRESPVCDSLLVNDLGDRIRVTLKFHPAEQVAKVAILIDGVMIPTEQLKWEDDDTATFPKKFAQVGKHTINARGYSSDGTLLFDCKDKTEKNRFEVEPPPPVILSPPTCLLEASRTTLGPKDIAIFKATSFNEQPGSRSEWLVNGKVVGKNTPTFTLRGDQYNNIRSATGNVKLSIAFRLYQGDSYVECVTTIELTPPPVVTRKRPCGPAAWRCWVPPVAGAAGAGVYLASKGGGPGRTPGSRVEKRPVASPGLP